MTHKKEAEKGINEQELNLQLVFDSTLQLLKFDNIQDIFDFSSKKIHELLNSKSIVIISEFDESISSWKICSISGMDGLEKISSLIGIDIVEMTGKVDSKFADEIVEGELTRLSDSLVDLTGGNISRNLEPIIKKIIGFKAVYTIAFKKDRRFYGNVTIIQRKRSAEPDKELIESFIKIVSLFIDKLSLKKQLKESEERFALAVKGSHDGIWDWIDLQQEEYWWSDKVFKIFGFEPNEFKPTISFWKNRIHPDDVDRVNKALKNSIDSNTPYAVEYRCKNKENSYLWLHAKGETLQNEKGKAIRMTGSVSDITDKKNAELSLLKSEQTYRVLFENSSDPTLIIENDKFIKCNNATVDFLGYQSKDEIEGKFPWELSPEKQPDGKNSKTKAAEMIQIAFDKGSNRFEWMHTKANGEERIIDVSLTNIPELKQLYTVWRDITESKIAQEELKKSEHKYRSLVDDMNEGLMQTDLNDRIEYVNASICSMLDYQAGELIGKIGYDTIVFDEDKGLIVESNLRRGVSIADRYMIRLKKKDGSPLWTQISGSSIINEHNQVISTIGLITDITEMKKTQDELQEHRDKLEDKVKQRTLELEEKNELLERMNDVFVGREFRIKELRVKIDELNQQLDELR